MTSFRLFLLMLLSLACSLPSYADETEFFSGEPSNGWLSKGFIVHDPTTRELQRISCRLVNQNAANGSFFALSFDDGKMGVIIELSDFTSESYQSSAVALEFSRDDGYQRESIYNTEREGNRFFIPQTDLIQFKDHALSGKIIVKLKDGDNFQPVMGVQIENFIDVVALHVNGCLNASTQRYSYVLTGDMKSDLQSINLINSYFESTGQIEKIDLGRCIQGICIWEEILGRGVLKVIGENVLLLVATREGESQHLGIDADYPDSFDQNLDLEWSAETVSHFVLCSKSLPSVMWSNASTGKISGLIINFAEQPGVQEPTINLYVRVCHGRASGSSFSEDFTKTYGYPSLNREFDDLGIENIEDIYQFLD